MKEELPLPKQSAVDEIVEEIGEKRYPQAARRCGNVKNQGVASHHEIYHVVDNLLLATCDDTRLFEPDPAISYFTIDGRLSYDPFCDDFGPMNLGTIYEFCDIVESMSKQYPGSRIALLSISERQVLTNNIFLLGAYLILKLDMSTSDVEDKFHDMCNLLLSYRDVSPGEQNFHLQVRDCWGGLARAKSLRWVDFGPEGFDHEEYSHFEDPLNADLHEILPKKFVAMRGPKSLHGPSLWKDHAKGGCFSHRDFSPEHYADILHQFDVQVVVRLNAPEYDSNSFEGGRIAVADLFFEDCTCPPVDVVAKFLMIAEGLPGALAVHCHAGLGRTGTLIALYIMKHHNFTAREAIGWIRIVRPGSIIGLQQQFLCDKEALMRRAYAKFQRTGPTMTPTSPTVEGVKAFIDRVHNVVDRYIEKVCVASRLGRTRALSLVPTMPQPECFPSATIQTRSSTRVPETLRIEVTSLSEGELPEHVSSSANRRCAERVRKVVIRSTSLDAM